jgi:succinate dehydrogenase/fumarate reductase cytochrome b subunit
MYPHPCVRRIHRLSAVLLGAFALVHITNHLIALRGIDAHSAFLTAARIVYRAPLVEPLLLAAVLVQGVTGVLQLRSGWGMRRSFWSRLQAISGGYLLFFLTVHVSAILVVRWLGLDSNFYAAAMVLTIPPLPLIYAPYYALGVSALFAHLACALHFAGLRQGINLDRACAGLVVGGVVVALPIVAAFSGAFYDIDLPQAYRDAVGRFL